jgi:alpha-galactosidase
VTSPRIAFLGAGSTVFTKTLLGDLLSRPELQDADVRLHDIDAHRLELSRRVAGRVAETLGASPRITATLDREAALDGADVVFSTIQVGGYRPGTVRDFEIPKRYGLEQTIGDTLGIGGIFRALRTIPVMLEFVRDMERLCPDALHLSYVNPMAMITWALNEASSVPTVGLCHSVPHTAQQLADDLGVPRDELRYRVAGINHLAFFLTLEHDGRDLDPRLRELAESGRVPAWNRVRYDAFRRLGRFVTESSEHFAEYVPWYLKRDRPDLVERFGIPIDEYPGRCEVYEVAWDFLERELDAPGSQSAEALRAAIDAAGIDVMPESVDHAVREFETLHEVRESVEYGAKIVHSLWTGTPRTVYGNVINHGLIDGLPDGCCVEVPCLVDGQGVQPTRVGTLPPQLTGLMRSHVNVQELVVRAVLDQDVRHVHHAALLEPRTAAQLDPDQIERLVNELLEAHADLLPPYLRPTGSGRVATPVAAGGGRG